jgi:hypothetical protein
MSLCLLFIGHVICFRPLLDMSFTFTFCWTCGFLSYFVGYVLCFRPSWFLLWSSVEHVSFFLLFIGYVIFLSSFVRDVVVCCGHQLDMAFAMTSDMAFDIALLYMVFAMILCWTWVLQWPFVGHSFCYGSMLDMFFAMILCWTWFMQWPFVRHSFCYSSLMDIVFAMALCWTWFFLWPYVGHRFCYDPMLDIVLLWPYVGHRFCYDPMLDIVFAMTLCWT